MTKLMTLCLLHDDNRILLGMKKRGFGQGRWNGFGGKVGQEESIEQAAIREMREEVGISALRVKKRGILSFEFEGQEEVFEMHIFSVLEFEGEPIESGEMKPQWFAFNEIPLAEMWPDDEHWLPLFLEGKNFIGRFLFRDNDILLKHNLEEIKDF